MKEIIIPFKGKRVYGTVLFYPLIVYLGKPTDKLRAHEMIHVKQIKRLGYFKFLISWIVLTIQYGYRRNPLEKEAYGDL